MKITFEDGTTEQCAPTDQRRINVADVLFSPERIPKKLSRVWDNPPTYSKLAVGRCDIIQPGHYVMTSTGLKRVAKIDKSDV